LPSVCAWTRKAIPVGQDLLRHFVGRHSPFAFGTELPKFHAAVNSGKLHVSYAAAASSAATFLKCGQTSAAIKAQTTLGAAVFVWVCL